MKSRKRLIWFVFALYCFAVLWITLFSRIGKGERSFLLPFWSYREIAYGNLETLSEDIKNVLLFVPFGFLLGTVTGWKRRYIILSGMFFSILIESCQWIFKLGSTEIDDVINNTIGTAIGSLLVIRNGRKTSVLTGIVMLNILIVTPTILHVNRATHMQIYAAMNDREDGTKNLLVLNGNPGKTWSGNVFVSYNNDGSITIAGSSDARSWKLIGELTLEPGRYSFSGLSGVEKNTIAIELEYFNKEQDNFIRLTPDVGPIDAVEFELEEPTRIKAYVGVYAGGCGEVVARPVIYKENR